MTLTEPFGTDYGDDLTFEVGPFEARLALHDVDAAFAEAFVAYVGGTLRPDEGGNWERGKRASEFLRQRELPCHAKKKSRLKLSYEQLDPADRALVDAYGATAGLSKAPRSTLLTEGEHAFYDWCVARVRMAAETDTFDKIVAGFGLTESETRDPRATTPGTTEGGESPGSPSVESDGPPPMPKRTDIVVDGVRLPDGYTDDVPDGMTVTETKRYVNEFIHKALIAEVTGRKRKGLIDWLSKKCTFKVPDEWRTDVGRIDNEGDSEGEEES